MSFLSRFSSRTKDRPARSSKRAASNPSTQQDRQDLLPLTLPTSSLLADASLANPLLLSSPSSHSAARDDDLRSLRSVDTTPWVHLDADSPVKPRPQQPLRPAVDPAREKRERIRLEKARLSPGEVTLLIEECGSVIRSRGLTTLGLFRPFRASESRPAIRALCLGFLDYVAECAARPTAADDARGTEASKAVLLHAFREELRYAGVHDVVAVLKWGLRHLTYSPGTSFSGPSPPSLAWYTTFLARTTPVSPPHAFSAFLLPSLPPPSQSLLLAALTLIQAVAAHAQENAMPSHRLCRLFAAHLFGLAPAACPSFDEAQRAWREAGAALEGCLRAFLAGQADLPPRLAELLDPRPGAAAQSEDRTVRVLRVELETRGERDAAGTGAEGVNDQATGRAAAAGDKPARRKPLEVLRSALGEGASASAGEDDAAAQAWTALRELVVEGEEGEGAEALLDEETLRVLDLLGLGAAGEPDDTPFALLAPGTDARARTQSHGEGAPAGGELGALGARFPNRSAGTLLAPQAPASWDAFASSGFAPAPSGEFGLLSQSQLLSRAEALALAARRARPAPQSTLLRVRLDSVDDALADAWLDSLEETRSALGPCAGWPSIVLAPLRRGAAARAGHGVEHLLVVEVLLPLPQRMLAPLQQQQHPGLLRAPSSASSRPGTLGDGALTTGRKWRRRASAIFSPSSTSLIDEDDGSAAAGLLPPARRSRKSLGRPSTAQEERAPPVPAFPSSSGGGPGTFVRSLSQGFASARRKGSRQSMYGGGLASPLEEEVPPPPLPEKVPSPRVEQQREEEEDEVRGYEVVTPQGSPVVERSLAPEGGAFDRQREEEEEPARPGMPAGLGRVAVPSPVMEEPELPLEDERADFERETLHPPTAVDPLTGSPTHLDAHPLAPLGAAPFANLSAIDAEGAEPLAAAGVPQLERAAAADDPAAAGEHAAEQDEPHVLLPQDDPRPVVEHESLAHYRTEDEPPLPQKPETADLPAVTEAEELVAPASLEEAEVIAAPAALQEEEDVAHAPLEMEQRSELSVGQVDPVPQPEASSPRADSLGVEQGETIAPATPTSPLVTLSPPPPEEEEAEAKELPSVPQEHRRDVEPAVEQIEHVEAPKPAPLGVAMGLGLVNAPIQPVEPEPESAPPATPKKDDLRSSAANPQTPHTLASPSLSAAAAHSPALSQGSQSSFGIPKSPTPSSSSTGSRKFLASVGGFLMRKKSAVDKEQARRDKADAAREKEEQKQLRKLREEELRREIKERKAPTPVSNVKARVREIEEEHAAVSAAPTSPATPSRVRTASSSTSPRPGTPTRSVSRHASVTSLRALSSAPAVPPPDEPLPALPIDAAPADAPAQAETHAERLEALNSSDSFVHAAEEPSMLLAPEPVVDEEHTGIIAQPSALTPAQELQHLQVKVPSSLDNLTSPIPSPTPQSAEPHNYSLIAGDDDHTAPLPDLTPPVFAVTAPAPLVDDASDDEVAAPAAGEEHTAVLPSLDVSSPVPAQTPEHLHVKVPSAFADLPPAAPSPTPRGEDDEGDVLAEDVTETIPDLRPPAFAPAGLAGLAAGTKGSVELEEPAALARNGQHAEQVEEVEHVEQVERVEQVEPDWSLAGEPASPDGHARTNGHAKEARVDTVVPAIEAVEGEVHSSAHEPSAHHAHEPPVTPSKPSSIAQNGTPVAHATPTASAVHDDVFSAAPTSAINATPTKPASAPLPHIVRASASQHSLSTTRSFETADSSAQSSTTTNEHWEPSEETF
ncbi:hypothetical protein JCM10450v2_007282 [Rhodotorula kratochvilovae]